MPYRAQRSALALRLEHLRGEHIRITHDIDDAEKRLAQLTPRQPLRWRRILGLGALASTALLFLGGVAVSDSCFGAMCCRGSRWATARSEIQAIDGAAQLHALLELGECVTVAQLVADGVLDESKHVVDPWLTPYRLTRDPDGVVFRVSSAGPDGHHGTLDDIF